MLPVHKVALRIPSNLPQEKRYDRHRPPLHGRTYSKGIVPSQSCVGNAESLAEKLIKQRPHAFGSATDVSFR